MTRLLGEFEGPDEILRAARMVRAAGLHRIVDAFTPLFVDCLADQIEGLRPTRIRLALLAGGLAGAGAGAVLQWYSAAIDLPLLTGGRPYASWPDFGFACFELGILGAALAGFAALLVGCGLPRLHHRLFEIDGFERATQDRFFLELEAACPADAVEAGEALRALGALRVHAVPQ